MNCKFCIWFELFTSMGTHERFTMGCKHKDWGGYILDSFKPPCSGVSWSINSGLQIIYVPIHILITNVTHPDAESGFIYSKCLQDGLIFCRYWSKINLNELRTKANSEATPIWRLVIKDTRPQELVQKAIKEIENE